MSFGSVGTACDMEGTRLVYREKALVQNLYVKIVYIFFIMIFEMGNMTGPLVKDLFKNPFLSCNVTTKNETPDITFVLKHST